MRRDVLAEIEDIRARMTAVDDFDSGILKLLMIVKSTEKLRDDDKEEEIHNYFVVASVAAIETYFRWQIQKVIDSDNERFLNNIRLDEIPIKLTHNVAVDLIGKRITVGELVAHAVSLSSFEHIAAFMTKLLATDFVQLVKAGREVGHADVPTLEKPGQVIADMKRAIELRHIICHEGRGTYSIPNSEIKRLSSSCYAFARGSYYAVGQFFNPAAPSTREDAFRLTTARQRDLQRSLKALEEKFAKGLHSGMEKDAFRAMEEIWEVYVGREATFFASVQMNGNQGELDAARTRVRLTERRIEELQQWLNKVDGTRPKRL